MLPTLRGKIKKNNRQLNMNYVLIISCSQIGQKQQKEIAKKTKEKKTKLK